MNVCVNDKNTLLLNKLKIFYEDDKNFKEFENFVDGRSISLRIIDYVCTKYSKEKPIIFDTKRGMSNVYTSYKDQLKAYSKKQFDPFKRHERIHLDVHGKKFETTVAQLNFFKWAIEIELMDLLERHLPKVEEHMKKS
tara:strand:- start:578 stop:991 length:414 start_codon:yes stop_codon:yes gene_type:complete